MASIDTYLECLKAKLGDEAYLLQHAPYEEVETTELFGEIKATSFKILLGYIRARPDNGAAEDSSEHLEDEDDMPVRKKQKVWMYMYPAQNSYCSPEIQLHAYALNGGYISKLDSENISKVISGFAPAFKLLGRHKWTKAKLIALAKYYFLRKLADSNNARDRELLQYGVNISNAFKDDLVSVCRNFQDMDKRASMKAVPVIVLDQESNQGSTLSEVSGVLHKEHSSPDSTSIKEEPVIQSKVVATYPHVTSTSQVTPKEQESIHTQLKLQQDQQEIDEDLVKIKKEIEQLAAKQREKQEQHARLGELRWEMFQGLSQRAAFDLMQRGPRDGAQKRRRLD